jgi:hypothetical protein
MFDVAKATQEIHERNRLRKEAHLPLLSVTAELKRLKRIESEAELAKFVEASSELYSLLWTRAVERLRRNHFGPDYLPDGWIAKMSINGYVRSQRMPAG